MVPVMFEKAQIRVSICRNGRLQVLKLHPGCSPNVCPLLPDQLTKFVKADLVTKLKPYFVLDPEDPSLPGIVRYLICGFEGLPDDLVQELLADLQAREV